MPNQLATPFPGPQPWEAPDPLPVMRRELKLLLIEMNVLRVDSVVVKAASAVVKMPADADPRRCCRIARGSQQ